MRRIFSKLLQSLLVMFIVSILCFGLIKLAPGDPVLTYVQPNMSETYIATLRESLGLNKPVYEQYLIWLGKILRGNFGYSLVNTRPVLSQILNRLPATLLLMGTSLLLSVLISIPLGMACGRRANGVLDRVVSALSYIGISIPNYWFGILLIYLFSVHLGWLPSIGMHSYGNRTLSDLVRHLILPCTVMTYVNSAQFTRYIRSSTITQMSADYVTVQRAYGTPKNIILFRHVLKNAVLPLITVLGMSLQSLVSGAMICEQVFAWPGTGQLAVTAVTTFDYPLIMGITMLTALMIIIGNLLADILYTIVDPRIRLSD